VRNGEEGAQRTRKTVRFSHPPTRTWTGYNIGMLLRFDLFQVASNGKLTWLGPVKDIADAQERVAKLPSSPKGFCVIDQEMGIRTRVEGGVASGS